MTIETKKENKLKTYLADHKEEILGGLWSVACYGIGIGVGYLLFGPNKEIRKFFKGGTRSVIGANFPIEKAYTVMDIWGETANDEDMARLGVKATDKVVGVMCAIAKTET